MFKKTSIEDVRQALNAIENIERPDGDNEGDPINSPSIYNHLSLENQKKVDNAFGVVSDYVRQPDGQPNNRSLTTLIKNGFHANLNQDQDDPYRYVGRVRTDNWDIDISDPTLE
ncbi:hypothetical protein [uncultured Thiothrix sp.]|jgi:hypothetical protein|uniref:hypothetical protein n=1 Tax=uncultured Thiothrix sp. TaxID=223185 RepID=UPI002615554C|nr:hypothetical protein [uncultured Thiothrix sp.]HRJ94990.1 hypothetical protein [Candidatus Thiothrix moscowensis]